MKLHIHDKQQGFTILELMVVVAIIAILALIAIPSYQKHVTKARLEQGKTVLNQAYLWMDKQNSKNGGYTVTRGGDAITNLPYEDTDYYTFKITQNCTYKSTTLGADKDENTFCLQAEPRGSQVNAVGGGKECGTLMVNQAGQYFIKLPGENNPEVAPSDCF